MQIDFKTIRKEFLTFLESLSDDSVAKNDTNLVSFASQISFVDIALLTYSNKIKNQNLFYWKINSENLEFLGFDPILKINKFGSDRLSETGSLINRIESNFQSNWNEHNLSKVPLIMGGIKFVANEKNILWKDFSDSDWFIPRLMFYKSQNRYFWVYNFNFSSDDYSSLINKFDESLSEMEEIVNEKINCSSQNLLTEPIYSNSVNLWEKSINKALEKISNGELSKVVLSREIKLELEQDVYLPSLLKQLGEKYPKCYTFAFKKGDSIFLGASPEKLAKFCDGWIEVDALAGSAPRGKSEIEDLEFENFLLNSKKNLFEQKAVVNFVDNLLKGISEEIHYEPTPIIRKLPNIQHLWTIIKAKLNSDFNLFDVLSRIHPTPAICGIPWEKAKDFIQEMEAHDRGLYSGNVGWFNFDGNGEFAVAIRSALIKSKHLYAYAGCGIVEGSEAKAEFEESEIKLKPILTLFVDEKIYQS